MAAKRFQLTLLLLIISTVVMACTGVFSFIATATDISTDTATLNVPENVEPSVFCADTQPLELIAALQSAVRNRDGQMFAELISPNGLYVSLQAGNNILLVADEVRNFFSDATMRDWGANQYSGTTIHASLAEGVTELLVEDLLAENVTLACNDNQDNLSTRTTLYSVYIPDYEVQNFYSVQNPGIPGYEHWKAWGLGMEYWNGKPRLAVLSYYVWTP